MKKIASLAIKILLIQVLFWIPSNTVARGPAFPEDLLPALGESGADRATEKQVASVLQKLGKTLILEHTRGAKDIAIYRMAAPAVVYVLVGTKDNEFSSGSGAIIDGKGHVVTNWHVVENYRQVFVVFKPKDSTDLKKELVFAATVVKVDQVADLALLKINNPPKALSFVPFGNISTLSVGQDVHAIGHPKGEVWTYTKGIISQIRPNYEWNDVHRATVIQTQTPINPGNSGGPLLNDQGRLIGINSFFKAKAEGLNYAVAVDEVRAFLKRRENRQAYATRRPKPATKRPGCPEAYDTTGQGWTNILGCYTKAPAPPPDAWLIYRREGGPVAYLAIDWANRGIIDRVVIGKNQSIYHFIDVDCNGTVDMVGHQRRGKKIDSYRVPTRRLHMVAMAKELDNALKSRKIPHTNLRVCQ